MPYEFHSTPPSSNGTWQLLRFRDQKYSGRISKPQQLIGPAVLFVLGHMGHFGQARSLATQGWFAAYLKEKCHAHHAVSGSKSNSTLEACVQENSFGPFETFVLDTSNLPVAASGGLLLSQAAAVQRAMESIQQLYAQPALNAKGHHSKVVIVAHSMGAVAAYAAAAPFRLGVTARGETLHRSIVNDTAAVITLAAPLTAAPLPLTPSSLAAYGYMWAGRAAFEGVPQIHLLGGVRDRLLWFGEAWRSHDIGSQSHMSFTNRLSLDILLPALGPLHGCSIDHISITWCRQVAYGIAQTVTAVGSSPLELGEVSFRQRYETLYSVWDGSLQHGAHAAEWAQTEARRQNTLTQQEGASLAARQALWVHLLGTSSGMWAMGASSRLASALSKPLHEGGAAVSLLAAVQILSNAALPMAVMAVVVMHIRSLAYWRSSLRALGLTPSVGLGTILTLAAVAAGSALGSDAQLAIAHSCIGLTAWYITAVHTNLVSTLRSAITTAAALGFVAYVVGASVALVPGLQQLSAFDKSMHILHGIPCSVVPWLLFAAVACFFGQRGVHWALAAAVCTSVVACSTSWEPNQDESSTAGFLVACIQYLQLCLRVEVGIAVAVLHHSAQCAQAILPSREGGLWSAVSVFGAVIPVLLEAGGILVGYYYQQS